MMAVYAPVSCHEGVQLPLGLKRREEASKKSQGGALCQVLFDARQKKLLVLSKV